MTPKSTARTVYHLSVTQSGDRLPVALEEADVIAWVRGFATALGAQDHLNAIDPTAPEDTSRVQALQIGDAQGWFRYLYPQTTEG